MDRKTARGNRLGLLLTGLALTALGLFTLLRGFRLLPQSIAPAGEPLAGGPVRQLFGSQGAWLWWLVALAAIVIALLGLRWLFVQGRSESLGVLKLAAGPGGVTRADPGAIADAVAKDIQSNPDVVSAHVRLVGPSAHPGVRLRLVADEHTRIGELRAHLGDVAFSHARQALTTDHLPAVTRVTLARRSPPRRTVT
ncbi:hypothetical protein SAMN05421505_11334 [Sinosporangium album]|uniref:Alkaline shock response membrane anchor protein AmaP n=1 Tax=Sinosporangium album TaxID=504805 RepID=A0A1G8AXL7_9ACTN|nr:hypothetical protein [Sinosporangium album]SDH25536.1 hypothetical protein SAMN05421505_11334 [Sinosporangium album]